MRDNPHVDLDPGSLYISRALSCVSNIHVVQMLVKPYVPSDKLEGSSVVNSVIDKLFVECLYGVFVLVS